MINDIAKDGNYSLILPSALTVYADPKSDITSQVIASIDKKVDTITLKEPAKEAAPK